MKKLLPFSLSPLLLFSLSPLLFFLTIATQAQDRCPYKGEAQPSRGASSYVQNFTITDTEGNTYELYEVLDSGKTVFIDLFFTRCSFCQQYTGIIEQIYQDTGAGEEDILMWGISSDAYDTDAVIDQYKADYGVTNPCAGPDGGGITAHAAIVAGQNFMGWPTYCVICPDRNMFFDPVYPPTVTGFNPYFEQCAAVMDVEENEADKASINIYPNPVKEILNIEINLETVAPVTLELDDLAGISVFQEHYSPNPGWNDITLDLSSLPPGYYILKLIQENRFIQVKRVVVL